MRADGRIRVAHVITRMIVGGAQETVLLAAALADRSRFDPVVVTGPQTGSEGSLHEAARARGVRVVVVPELVREVSPRRDVAAVPALAQVFRKLGADLVHTNSSKAGVVGRLAARRAHVGAVVHTVHGWPFHDHQSPLISGAWRRLERHTAPLAARLVVVAETDRGKGLAAGIGRPDQYVTVRSGVELALFRHEPGVPGAVRRELGLPLDVPVIGAVNRLSGQKDPVTLVESFAAVAARRPDAWLLVVGDGPLRPVVEGRLRALGLSHRAVLTGLRPDVPRLFSAMDVFVSASLYEGLPRTVIAAMASGIPVVATPVDGVVDVLTDGVTGLMAPVRRPDLLGGAVVRLLDEPLLRAQLAEAAAARVEEFDAHLMVRRLEALYEQVLASS